MTGGALGGGAVSLLQVSRPVLTLPAVMIAAWAFAGCSYFLTSRLEIT
ncbi:hypothetical protein Salmuc_00366 [Salipiger mucosus DSM 16094]|uniref:Uncharacterized protein n=2 Tax=Salipiger mucosus TaxID=263378 RepID=S9REC5_9RHOB|nr:hypothetical protein Salmuc_00366 [Salipiger mucosus DSM 16094]